MRFKAAACLIVSFLFGLTVAYGQAGDSTIAKIANFPSKLFGRIQAKTASLDQQLTSQTQKYVRRMQRQEAKLKKQLSGSDSNAAKELFAGSGERYDALAQRLRQDSGSKSMLISGAYHANTDSLRGTLAFLQQNPQLIAGSGSSIGGSGSSLTSQVQANVQKAASQLQGLQAKLQDATIVQQFMQQRQEQIQQYLSKYTQLPAGVSNAFSGYQAQVAYYKQQVSEYEQVLDDPDKLFQTALTLLNKVPAFSTFMQRNSVLSAFAPGGSAPSADPGKPGQGLPGRDQVLAGLQEQLGKNGLSAEAVAQKSTNTAVQSAGGSAGTPNLPGGLSALFSGGGLSGMSGSTGTGSVPAGGIGGSGLNPENSKTFLHRLEFGFNMQNTPSTYLLPTTTDVGVSVAYKLNGQNRLGIGASYKVGWAGDIHHVSVSSQGAAIRTFLDIAISKNWLATGGAELNYQPIVYSVHLLKDLENWQSAGLVGFTKVIPIKSKLIKNTRLQFLWDFLSYYQRPTPQAFIFRLGYSF